VVVDKSAKRKPAAATEEVPIDAPSSAAAPKQRNLRNAPIALGADAEYDAFGNVVRPSAAGDGSGSDEDDGDYSGNKKRGGGKKGKAARKAAAKAASAAAAAAADEDMVVVSDPAKFEADMAAAAAAGSGGGKSHAANRAAAAAAAFNRSGVAAAPSEEAFPGLPSRSAPKPSAALAAAIATNDEAAIRALEAEVAARVRSTSVWYYAYNQSFFAAQGGAGRHRPEPVQPGHAHGRKCLHCATTTVCNIACACPIAGANEGCLQGTP
jgi:hypothetical protein